MSLLDQLRALEDQVAKRITELRPAVAEFYELRKVAERLGLSDRLGLTDGDAPAGDAAPRPDATIAADATATPTTPRRETQAKTPETRRRPKASDQSATRARVGTGAVSAKSPPRRPLATTSAKRRSTATDAKGSNGGDRGGARQQQILNAVRATPGMTVAELARQLGVPATNLYRPIKRLQERGEVTKAGTKLTAAQQAASGA